MPTPSARRSFSILITPSEVRTACSHWEIIYRIPNDFVRLFFPAYQPEPGKVLRANCFKCGDLTVQPHYIAWNPVQSLTPNFHRSQDFGMMRFLLPHGRSGWKHPTGLAHGSTP